MAWDTQNSGGFGYPLTKMNFLVSVDNSPSTLLFSEVTGIEANTDVIEFRPGNSGFASAFKVPGLVHHGNITLKFGTVTTTDDPTYEWMVSCLADQRANFSRKSVTITLLNSADNLGTPDNGVITSPPANSLQWTLENAWVCKMSAPDLDAKGNDIAIQSVEIAYESMIYPGKSSS